MPTSKQSPSSPFADRQFWRIGALLSSVTLLLLFWQWAMALMQDTTEYDKAIAAVVQKHPELDLVIEEWGDCVTSSTFPQALSRCDEIARDNAQRRGLHREFTTALGDRDFLVGQIQTKLAWPLSALLVQS